jgi:hypothetical protein
MPKFVSRNDSRGSTAEPYRKNGKGCEEGKTILMNSPKQYSNDKGHQYSMKMKNDVVRSTVLKR